MQAYRPPRAAKQHLWRPAWVALGGNMGDVRGTFRWAINILHGAHTWVEAISAVYETEPMRPSAQATADITRNELPFYINAACAVRTRLGPHQLLRFLQSIERAAGRHRSATPSRRDRRPVWGPRPLDLDLLAFDQVHLAHRQLKLPHPAWAQRAFVLRPLADLGVNTQLWLPSKDGRPPADRRASGGGSVRSRNLSWLRV